MDKVPETTTSETEEYQFKFLDVPYEHKVNDLTSSNSFTVLSYNVLADCLVFKKANELSSERLNFEPRNKMVLKQMAELKADIMFLQEIDRLQEWEEPITELGYKVLYFGRLVHKDGLILAFKTELFELVESNNFRFDDENDFDSSLNKDHIYIACKLKHKASGKQINLINTHLHHDPNFDLVKYFQMGIILQKIHKLFNPEEIIIWGGDINTLPVGNLMRYVLGKLAPELSYMEIPKEEKMKTYEHTYELVSKLDSKITWKDPYQIYGKCTGIDKQTFPDFTNLTLAFRGTIDHLFYNDGQVIPRKLLRVPDINLIKGDEILPNKVHPSDHLPLMVVFEIPADNKESK